MPEASVLVAIGAGLVLVCGIAVGVTTANDDARQARDMKHNTTEKRNNFFM